MILKHCLVVAERVYWTIKSREVSQAKGGLLYCWPMWSMNLQRPHRPANLGAFGKNSCIVGVFYDKHVTKVLIADNNSQLLLGCEHAQKYGWNSQWIIFDFRW